MPECEACNGEGDVCLPDGTGGYKCRRALLARAQERSRPMARGYAVYICGGDMRPGPRGTDCPDPLHDHPLPAGYVDASEEAASRLYRRWHNVRCQQCGLYGWVPPAASTAPDHLPDNDESRGHEPVR